MVIQKTFEGKKPVTYLQLTSQGRHAIEAHWQKLDALRNGSQVWDPE